MSRAHFATPGIRERMLGRKIFKGGPAPRRSEQSLNETPFRGTNHSVKARGALQVVRVVIVLVMIAAWFVVSDHCALASVLIRPVETPSAEEHCPGHSQPEKKPDQSEMPCCKSLAATVAPATVLSGYDTTLFVPQPYLATEAPLVFRRSDAPSAELDTGPPDARSFAESVLQRSILAHAPPLLA